MVLATQNPIETEGTYPLPEAQLDRFLFKIEIDYPSRDEEVGDVVRATDGPGAATAAARRGDAVHRRARSCSRCRRSPPRVRVDEQVVDYAVRIVRATRDVAGARDGRGPARRASRSSAARAPRR